VLGVWDVNMLCNGAQNAMALKYYSNLLDHTNPVGNVKGIKILAQTNISLLQAPGGNKGVDPVTFNLVKILH